MDVQELVKRHQAGEDVRGDIEKELEHITRAVITRVCGKSARIYRPDLGGWVDLQPFMFNDDDIEKAINKSLDEALRTYSPDHGAIFETWYYKKLNRDLKHLEEAYKYEQEQGRLINSTEAFNREIDNLGNVFNPEILQECQFITAEELEELSDNQIKYIVLSLTFYGNKKRMTDGVIAAALGVERNSIQRYKKELEKALTGSNDRRELHKKRKDVDDLPALLNEHGNIDPVPREAARNIKRAKS